MRVEVAIIGAGMTGLGTALDIGLDAAIFEKDPVPGGCLRSDVVGGYTIDRTGHLLHMRSDYVRHLMFERLQIDWLHFDRNAVVHVAGRRVPYPIQYNLRSLPDDIRERCVQDFLSVSGDPPRLEDDFEDWSRRSFGKTLHDVFFAPYNRKLWQASLSSINAEWAERFVPMPDKALVLDGARGIRKTDAGYNARFSYPLNGGSQAIVNAVASEVQSPIHVNAGLMSLDPDARTCEFSDGSTVKYGSLVSTLPLPTLLRMIHRVDPAILELGERLRHNSIRYFAFGFKVSRPAPPEHWIYVPEEKFLMYRVGILSNYSPRVAPSGSVLVCAEVAYPGELASAIDPAESRERVLRELRELGIVEDNWDLELEHFGAIDCAYALFDDARKEGVDRILAYLADRNIRSVGRYGSWDYGSMEDALLEGRNCADALRKERRA